MDACLDLALRCKMAGKFSRFCGRAQVTCRWAGLAWGTEPRAQSRMGGTQDRHPPTPQTSNSNSPLSWASLPTGTGTNRWVPQSGRVLIMQPLSTQQTTRHPLNPP